MLHIPENRDKGNVKFFIFDRNNYNILIFLLNLKNEYLCTYIFSGMKK